MSERASGRARSHLRATLAALIALLAASAVHAEEPPRRRAVRLDVVRGAGTEPCPGSDRLRAMVAARLGYDPFTPDAAEQVRVHWSRSEGAYFATLSWQNDEGVIRGERRTPAKLDCAAALEDAALALAIALDPLVLTRPLPAIAAEPVAPEAAAAQRPRPEVEAVAPEPQRAPLRFSGGAAAHAAIGAAPGLAAAGASMRGGLVWDLFSLDVEARGDLPASASIGGGPATVEAALLVAGLAPCARLSWFRGCLLGGGGVLRAAAHGLERARTITSPYGFVGGRAAVDVPLGGALFARAALDVIAPLARVSLVDSESGERFWSTPPLSAALGLGLGFEIPPAP